MHLTNGIEEPREINRNFREFSRIDGTRAVSYSSVMPSNISQQHMQL